MRVLLASHGLRVAVFTKGLPVLENRLSLFSGVAKAKLVEASEQSPASLVEKAGGQTGAIFGGYSRLSINQNC